MTILFVGLASASSTCCRSLRERLLPIAICLDKTGIANTQQSPHFLDCLSDHAAWLAAFKLAFQLNENLIGAI